MSVDLRLVSSPSWDGLRGDENVVVTKLEDGMKVTFEGEDSYFYPEEEVMIDGKIVPHSTYPHPCRASAVSGKLLKYLAEEYGTMWYTDCDFAEGFDYYSGYAKGMENTLVWYYMFLTTWKDYCPEGMWKGEYDLLIDLGRPIFERIDKQMEEEAREMREIPCQGTTETLLEVKPAPKPINNSEVADDWLPF